MVRQPAKPRRRSRGRFAGPGRGLWMPAATLCAAAALVVNVAVGATAATAAATGTAASASSLPANTAKELPASSADQAALLHAYLKARGLPAGTATGVRNGSLHVAETSNGDEWALASFKPAWQLKQSQLVGFQDGAASGIFRRAPGQAWQFVQAGVEPVGCDAVVPSAVRTAWNVAANLSCSAGSSSAVKAASQARASVDATQSLAANVASIALSQVGVSDSPVVTSFDTVDCDPYTPMVGPWYPNPDSRGCGYNAKFGVEDENEEWCSDFAEWVWLKAGITQDMDLINPGADSFYSWGLAQGESLPVDGTDPQVGDAVVLYPPGQVTASTGADHVGIVTAVNADGTLNIVNGDFLGTNNISVQYNTDVSIGPWAAEVEGDPGEQWVFVSPPTTAQSAAPVTSQISGPHVVVAGTEVTYRASASESGGSVASEVWAFGNGEYEPNGTANGEVVQHVFADPGRQTVSVVATSNLGAITVKTLTVDVVAASSALVSTASDALYYAYTPVSQSLFVNRPSSGLAEETWDGAGWMDENLPGDVAADSPVATLQYKNSSGAFEPHVFARSTGGALIEDAAAGGTWSTATLPGSVASGSAIVATTIASRSTSEPAYPAVFSYDAAGRLTETYGVDGSWKTDVLPAPPGNWSGALAVATSFQGGVPVPKVYSVTRQGWLVVTSELAGHWRSIVVPSRIGIAKASSLAAVSSPAEGSAPAVFFVDHAGHVAEASQDATGRGWTVGQISATAVAPGGTLLATNFVPSSGSPQPDVNALSTSGQPLLISSSDGTWATQALPGTATSLLAQGDYAVPGSPQSAFFDSAQGIEEDSNTSGAWALSGPLPATAATFAERVILYAATQADLTAATKAAAEAGLPSSAVTGSFATGWDHGLSGNYLVITVGLSATDALYFNVCGWTNPSDAFPGSTPFFLANPPVDQLPGADTIEEAAGSTTAQTTDLAYDLAYYALHGTLPPGVTSLPTEASPEFTCSGEPSV